MQRVLVLSSTKKPLMPCHPARARELLRKGKAAVYRKYPFTIILKYREDGESQPVEFKVDPGSKVSGMALVSTFLRGSVAIWGANLKHRGDSIRMALTSRLSLRRGRRSRKTRYRAPRFNNRTRLAGWLPPSLMSRVESVLAWAVKLLRFVPVRHIAVETVRFDTQLMQNPEVSGVEYQQGELQGYEVREYLLEKWGRKCAYCDTQNVPLEIEHIHPKSKGGSDRTGNLTLACVECNKEKGNRDIREFLSHDKPRLAKILAQTKAPLKDAAAVNSTRYAIGRELKKLGLPVSFWTGGRTKYNRTRQGYLKDHWVDAACVGESGACVKISPAHKPLTISATGRGSHQVVRTDRYGFPASKAGRVKRVSGFQTGDIVRLVQPNGKYAGVHKGRLAGIRATGQFDIKTEIGKITAPWTRFSLVQRMDGYAYA